MTSSDDARCAVLSGYVGSHVATALRAAGAEVVVLDDLTAGVADRPVAGVPLVRGPVGDPLRITERDQIPSAVPADDPAVPLGTGDRRGAR